MRPFHLHLESVPRTLKFPLRPKAIGFLKNNWYNVSRNDPRSINFGLILSCRHGASDPKAQNAYPLKCPYAALSRPGETWRNLAPGPWDEVFVAYPASMEDAFVSMGFTLGTRLEIAIGKKIEATLETIANLAENVHGAGNIERLDATCYQLLLECLVAPSENEAKDPVETAVRELASRVRLNFRERPDIEGFCREKGVGYRTFARKWRALLGVPPTRYALNLRMEEARRLLKETKTNVSTIAYQLGFEDPLYFSRIFRRAEKVSPRAYRHHPENDDQRSGKSLGGDQRGPRASSRERDAENRSPIE